MSGSSHRLRVVDQGESLPALPYAPGVPPLHAATLAADHPDRTLLLERNGSLVARCSCWTTATPLLDGRRTGLIGHYAAAAAEDGVALLQEAGEILHAAGATTAIGPMDGSTWRRYRFIVERGAEPTFFLEPDNPDDYPDHWMSAGFSRLATYTSALNDRLSDDDPRTDERLARLARGGVEIRNIDVARADDELRRLFSLSLAAFRDNFLYTPISESEFDAQYRAVLPYVDPRLVLLAERHGELAGFIFAVPDFAQKQRGEAIDTVILKTLAVHPSHRGEGLGGVLLDLAQRRAGQLGYARVIHALIHESNVSGRISARYAHTIRRYAVFSRSLP